jgi:hypothetical protein
MLQYSDPCCVLRRTLPDGHDRESGSSQAPTLGIVAERPILPFLPDTVEDFLTNVNDNPTP